MRNFRLTQMVLSLASVFSVAAGAAGLSANLPKPDIREAVKIIGWGSNHRAFTAHGMTNEGLGLDVGFEAPFFLTQKLDSLGDGTGNSPGVMPIPRFWAAWDFPGGFNYSMSISPGSLYGGVTEVGVAGQWNFFRKERVVVSALLSYTYANAFEGDITTHSPGLMVQISKNLEKWQPFAAFGFISSNGSVKSALTAPGVDTGPYTTPATHLSAGFRLDLMAQLVFQLDLIGTRPSGAILFSHRF